MAAAASILVVEDDPALQDLLDLHLGDLGYRVDVVGDGRQGLERARVGDYALIILDRMLPGMEGLEVCRALRAEGNPTPVLLLTARGEEADKVHGLEGGADDYVTKPFSIRELLARVGALISRRYLDGALAQTRRLGSLVGQLFELSKLDAGQVELQCEAFPLAELVQDVVVHCEPEAEQRGIALRAVLPEDGLPLVHSDIGLVERVLTNLLDNALRYTPAGGRVEVRPWAEVGWAWVEVADTGVGIAPEQLPRVFDRFYRADAARSNGDGAGLGLAIVHRIVELHGGEIAVESTPGEGTRFTFSLPTA